ncbi:MAG: hypothetical protein GEU92_06875 [Alphaproteobacteria bacterium]|nr:hypothetical protein [Alphaproteobacteria bacterium]
MRPLAMLCVFVLALLHAALHDAAADSHVHFDKSENACQIATLAATPAPAPALPARPARFRLCHECADHQATARFSGASWSSRAPPA